MEARSFDSTIWSEFRAIGGKFSLGIVEAAAENRH